MAKNTSRLPAPTTKSKRTSTTTSAASTRTNLKKPLQSTKTNRPTGREQGRSDQTHMEVDHTNEQVEVMGQSEDGSDTDQNEYRPRGPSTVDQTATRTRIRQSGAKTQPRIASLSAKDQNESCMTKKTVTTARNQKSGQTSKSRKKDEIETDDDDDEAEQNQDSIYSGESELSEEDDVRERKKTGRYGGDEEEEEEEEEEEQTRTPGPIDHDLNMMQQRLLEKNKRTQSRRTAEKTKLLERSYTKIKGEMDLARAGDNNKDHMGAGEKESWDGLMKNTRSIINTIETMLAELDSMGVGTTGSTAQGSASNPWAEIQADLEAYKEATDPMIDQLKDHVNGRLTDWAQTIMQTGQQIDTFPHILEKAQKRAVKHAKRKMQEQYEIAQRNITAKSYINSVAKIMGVDLTPFRD